MTTHSALPPPAEAARSRAHPSIGARLSLWYGLVVFLALVAAGGAVLWLQARLGLARVDQELDAAAVTVSGVLRNELDEGLSLADSVRDMMAELSLTGEGFAIVSVGGAVLGAEPASNPPLSDAVLLASRATPATVAIASAGTRIRATPIEHLGHHLRVVTWKSLAPLQAERSTLVRAMLLGIPLTVLIAIAGGRIIGLERLAASLHQQRAFMADASHQLRTPVSVIRTTAQVMLSREPRPEAEYRESLDVVARQAQRLTKSVDDMFILALADAEARPLQLAPLYLDELIGEVVDDLRMVAEARHITLRAESAGDTPFVGDEYLLRQMLTNLLENAIRHTPPVGTVSASLARAGGVLTITVTDTGPGIARDATERIFERFVRLDSPGSESRGGLGLPIARWIAEAHGGTLSLAVTGPSGSQFLITLPS